MIELINFINLTLEEKKMILSWRNHQKVKQWMYNTDDISIENHLKFIESLKDTREKLYFLVKQDKEYIGVIDFYNINYSTKVTEFGLYSNVNCKIAGIGRILEKASIDFIFDTLKLNTLKLEVFSDNIKVINLHKKFKFKEVDKRIVNDREVICMELKYENR